jgi:hypothetical protein
VTPDTRTERLKAMDSAWKAADADEPKEEKREWENPPDGDYQARVHSFDFHDGKGGLALRTQFEIVGPSNMGWKVSTFHPLENPERLKWTKRHLEALGVVAFSLEELETNLQTALDKVCEVVLKTRKGNDGREYQNLYLNRVMEGITLSPEGRTEEPPPHTDNDEPAPKRDSFDDIPF